MKSLYMESLITGKFRENLPLDVLQDLYTYAATVRKEINREIQRRESKEKATSSKNWSSFIEMKNKRNKGIVILLLD